jgi:hypothetical protein
LYEGESGVSCRVLPSLWFNVHDPDAHIETPLSHAHSMITHVPCHFIRPMVMPVSLGNVRHSMQPEPCSLQYVDGTEMRHLQAAECLEILSLLDDDVIGVLDRRQNRKIRAFGGHFPDHASYSGASTPCRISELVVS